MNNVFKSLDTENKAYLTKLRLELKSVQLLTSKILSELENRNDHETFKQTPNVSRLAVTNSSKIIAIEELYYDVNKYLMALIQYMESSEELQFVLPTIINGPKFCHLPTVCNMLWRRIETMNKRSHVKSQVTRTSASSKETEDVLMSSKRSQTEISSLTYCESCHLATELIKSLVHLILETQEKHNVEETNSSNFRERIRNELFEMSQWGVMKGWAAAVQADIEWLLTLTVSSLKKCERLDQKGQTMKQEHKRAETALQNDLDLTRKQLEAEQAQSTYLKQQIENLNTSLTRRIKQEKILLRNIQEYREKLKIFGESLTFIRDDCKQMRASQKSLGTFVRSIMLSNLRNISDFKNELVFIIKKTEDNFQDTVQKKNLKLNEVLKISEERENVISALKTNISELHDEKKELNEKLRILIDQKGAREDEIIKIREKVMEFEKLFEQSKASEQHDESKKTFPYEKNLEISGDPLTDMENQRQMNKQKIKALLRENVSLKSTISKLKKIKTEHFECTSSTRTQNIKLQ